MASSLIGPPKPSHVPANLEFYEVSFHVNHQNKAMAYVFSASKSGSRRARSRPQPTQLSLLITSEQPVLM